MSTGELYFCCDERRRAALRAGALTGSKLNGIDFLEVESTGAIGGEQRQLRVRFVNPPSGTLKTDVKPATPPYRITIEGGEQVRGVRVKGAKWEGGELVVEVDRRGDFSTYTFRLGFPDGRPLAGMDPLLSAVDFSFKATCPAPGDCAPECDCPPEERSEPEIDYLAKDYASFRQVMLDRMALVLPGWQERSPADLGIVLVEMLAYVGDYLSWQQDAVATEAYLGTARRRVSVRRHARILDYPMHDGCNARTWLQVEVRPGSPAELELPARTEALTRLDRAPLVIDPAGPGRLAALAEGPEVFETLHPARLRAEHNRIGFWTWGQRECCLPRGATRATLAGHYPDLRSGDVLVLEEVVGPATGAPADADTAHRHAVRLVRVNALQLDEDGAETNEPLTDPVFQHLRAEVPITWDAPDTDRKLAVGDVVEVLPPWDGVAGGGGTTWSVRDAAGREGTITADPVTDVKRFEPPVTLVEWHRDDALPFALCLSSVTTAERGGRHVADVSVARGNVVLADHGLTVKDEEIGTPPEANPWLAPAGEEACGCGGEGTEAPPGRFRPRLREGPLTQATRARRAPGTPPDQDVFFDPAASATAALRSDPGRALPVIQVRGADPLAPPWRARRDLLASGPFARDVVAEVDDGGRAELRFGDDELGERPQAGVPLLATYRVGNGTAGNLGNDALAHLVSDVAGLPGRVLRVRNPLPGAGGTGPEAVERVRQVAPAAFRVPARAVTPADYARMAERHPQVQRAEATLRWTGSWRTVFLTVDRAGGLPVDAAFAGELRLHLERYRMAGHDLEIVPPRFVPLEVEVFACVEPAYFRGDVERALREALGSRAFPDGRRGFFHPDRYTFGQSVLLSRLYAAVNDVAGLSRVEVRVFRRLKQTWTSALETGELKVARLEVARLDDDPSHPDRGELRLLLEGGR